jgi:hypothetical protein
MLEKEFQKKVIDLAKFRGWRVHHTRTVQVGGNHFTPLVGDRGFPDLVMTHPTRGTIFVELKTDKGRLSEHQVDWINDLAKTGMECYVWRPANWQNIIDRLASQPAGLEYLSNGSPA